MSMKRHAFPLACTATRAQSSVTLYGIVDTGVKYVNRVPQGSQTGSVIRKQSGNLAGSLRGPVALARAKAL
ncbi:porin [Paraburkholderia sacchari]|uniref:porin n=1 Tax=Paraburkholderia sacchari TaxID=159450 RepID=UPI003D989189